MINSIEYNSQKEHLTISEYGRKVQNLVKYAKTIENDEERQHFAEAIIVKPFYKQFYLGLT